VVFGEEGRHTTRSINETINL